MAARRLLFLALALSTAGAPAQNPSPALDTSLLTKMEARAIGPAVVGGRIGAVAGVPGDPTIIWAGAAAGGVWKSTDGGIRFEAVFDDQDVASIGAIAIHPRSTDIVWVGSGEGNPRNSASVGRGIYRSLDGGRHWSKLGLEKTERIHRIVLHPDDTDVAWVAAFGTSWSDSEERGVFKTVDGGKTWQKLDADDGLPKGELGRIGLAIAPSDPNVVYALTEAKKSVLLRSDDGGFRFRTINKSDNIAPRPFYFCDIRVDPQDPNRVYNMHTVIDVSTDGGRSFQGLVGWDAAHPDHHSMWIDPSNPARILIGNDGGVYTSNDRGASWNFCRNLPLAQFYHIAVDNEVPYNIYGGLQDNGSWRGPSTVWENGGIRNLHWQEVCFGDGFATVPDPNDSRQGYAMSQGGSLVRYDLRTGSRKSIRPPTPEGLKLRFHWNAAIALDPFDGCTVYYGSQFVHKSESRGEGWQIISPDLTTDNPDWQKQEESGGLTIDVTAAENHCCIITLAPSSVQRGVLWAGTDDGRVQVTRDGGDSWTSVESNIPNLPNNTWCPHIEASKFDAATAFAVFDGHRRTDWTPYVYVTRDFGQTWVSIATDGIDGYCHVIEQDPLQKDLLWVGTEFGLFVSLDGGKQWHAWRHGVPTCAARAITTQARDGDLIVGTHGCSIFVIDDISPLRSMSAATLQKKLHCFEPRPTIMHGIAQTPSTRFPGQGEFRGPTLASGVTIQLIANAPELKHPDPKIEKTRKKDEESAEGKDAKDENSKDGESKKKEPKDKVTIEVRDRGGKLIRTFRRDVHLGLNRIRWMFERDGTQGPSRTVQKKPEMPPRGRRVLPGAYTLTVRFQGESQEITAHVLPDPRVEIAMADRTAKDALRAQREGMDHRLHVATQRLAPIKKQIDVVRQRLAIEEKPEEGDDPMQTMRDALKAVDKAHKLTENKIWGETKKVQGISRGNDGLLRKATTLMRISGGGDAPNQTEIDGMARAVAKVEAIENAVAEFLSGPFAEFRKAVDESKLSLLPAAAAPADESDGKK